MIIMKKLKIGVFGAGRGKDIAQNFQLQNCEIVALCDFHEKRRKHALEVLGGNITAYDNFDDFLNHDMDAVIVANYFHEHAPYVIKCFEKNIHVYCECISNGTMAEGVALARAHEKSESIFFMAENYPQMIFNREMQRVVKGGTLGRILYAEGEYNHPGDPYETKFLKTYNYFLNHWRQFNPSTYYVTHSLGPLMRATGATPKTVTAMAIFEPAPSDVPTAGHNGDRAAIMMTQNDDGSVFRFTGCASFGAHHNVYRICGTKGQIQNLPGMDGKIMLRYNGWELPEGKEEINCYMPEWNDKDEEQILKAGHGGSDFISARMFIECIQEGKQPDHPFDLYGAINMSSVAILAHRSMLEGSKPYTIPDFHDEEARKQYENDWLTPYYSTDGKAPTLPCCSVTDYAPTEEQIAGFLELIKD